VDVGLQIDRAFVESPQQCGDGTTALTSELILSDGKHPSVRQRLQTRWTCLTKHGEVTKLEIGED
jgi:hypothetical protein